MVAILASGLTGLAAEPDAALRGASSRLDAVLASFPARSNEQARALYAQILDGGKETVAKLCSRIEPSSAGGSDAAVRFAVHGLANYAARHGADKQRQLVAAVLTEALPGATEDDVRDFLLEQLRFVADKRNIPAVGGFLLDAKTAHRAAAVLLSVGGRDAESALLAALPKAAPACAAPIIQALGDLGSGSCVKECADRLDSTNAAVQCAALYALSRSESPGAGEILAARRQNPPAGIGADTILNACLDRAERLMEKGRQERAAALLARGILGDKAVCGAAPRCRALAILGMTRDPAHLPLLMASLGETNHTIRCHAAAQIACLRGRKVTPALLAAARAAQGDARAALLVTLSHRPDFKDAALLGEGLRSEDDAVRAAALDGLRRMNTAEAARILFGALEKAGEQDRQPLAAAVRALSSRDALAEVAASLASPSPAVREAAVRTLMDHRARVHAPAILQLTRDPDPAVARTAFKALVLLVGDREVPALLDAGLAATDAAYRSALAETLVASAPRLSERTKFAGQLVSAYKTADPALRAWILPLLPVFGGASALETATAAAASPEAGIRDAAIRALAAWPDEAALPALLAMSTNDSARAIVLPGAARLLRESRMPASRRLEMYAQALKAASSANQIWEILSAMSELHVTGAIELLVPLLEREDVRREAAMAIAAMACPKAGEPPALPRQHAAALRKACELVADKALQEKFSARLAAPGK